MMRKVISHSVVYDSADNRVYQFALCNDGTMWERVNFSKWQQSDHTIPQNSSPTTNAEREK